MGNITTGTTRPLGAEEVPARIGVHLGAQRVELYRVVETGHAVLVRHWAALFYPDGPVPSLPIPLSWFPWSLGNIRPEEYMFVRNADALATCPTIAECEPARIGELRMSSAVYLPILGPADDPETAATPIGAMCAYWAEERSSWPSDSGELVRDWARNALSDLR